MNKRVTQKDIAGALNLTPASVSMALRNDPQLPEQTRLRVKKMAEKLGYVPNPEVTHLMSQLRRGRPQGFRSKLALVNAGRSPDALKNHPTIPIYVEGCYRRAAALGYEFDHFWMHDPQLTARSWIRILKTRNIKGIIIVGLMHSNKLPANLSPVWNQFPVVLTGVRTENPPLSFACVDHYNLALHATRKALELGYRKPALVLDPIIDQLVEFRFSAGYRMALETATTRHRPRSFQEQNTDGNIKENFARWFTRESPDCLLILYHDVLQWLKSINVHVPKDIGIIQLEWRKSNPFLAGMNQHNDLVGEAAVDLVINQIHNPRASPERPPPATIIGPTWSIGASVGALL